MLGAVIVFRLGGIEIKIIEKVLTVHIAGTAQHKRSHHSVFICNCGAVQFNGLFNISRTCRRHESRRICISRIVCRIQRCCHFAVICIFFITDYHTDTHLGIAFRRYRRCKPKSYRPVYLHRTGCIGKLCRTVISGKQPEQIITFHAARHIHSYL